MKFLNTLRGKLTLLFFVSMVTVTVLTFFLLIFTTQKLIQDQVDHHLHIVINEAKKIVENNKTVQNSEPLRNLIGGQGMTVILLSSDGTPILQTNSPDVATVTTHQMQQIIFSSSGKARTEPKHFTIGQMQFATVPVNISDYGQGILAVGFSTEIINLTIKKITTIIILILLTVIIVISILWQMIIKYYLLPLEQISNSALKIKNSKDLKRRIQLKTTTIELSNIVTSFNNLLEKLRKVFEQEHLFFSDTAHSLKTPLAVIRSYIETLDKQEKNKKEQILKSIDLLNETIQDLLIISKINTDYTIKKKKINLSKLVKKIAELTQTIASEKNINVTTKIDTAIFTYGDEKLLTKAILNVIKNAVDHEKHQGHIKIELTKKAKLIKLTISDTGIGINKKDLKNIFKRFYQTNNSQSRKGSGLGLSITKAVIENMGGKIKISSQLNKGTTVFIFFS